MRTNKKELEVDSIGGQGALSKEEARALSDYFQNQKQALKKENLKKGQNTSARTKKII